MSTGSELYDLLAKTNATLNPNNTITLRFNDGSSYTTGVIKDGPELSPADKAMEEAKEASVISQAAMEEAGKAAIAAGNAEQSASEAAASATNAENFASEAQQSASTASTAALLPMLAEQKKRRKMLSLQQSRCIVLHSKLRKMHPKRRHQQQTQANTHQEHSEICPQCSQLQRRSTGSRSTAR